MELSTLEIKISSVEIAERTGKEHSKVKRDIEAQLGQIVDVAKFGGIYKDSYGREQDCYYLPKRETLILVSGYSVELRSKIIDRLEELEKQKPQFQIPQTLSQALLLASQQAETIEKQNHQLEYQKPFVAFAECVSTAATDILIRDWAKMIGVQEKLCRKWLIEKGYMYDANKNGKTAKYRVSAEGIERGYLVQREVPIVNPNPSFPNSIGITVKMTPKGQTALTDKIKKDFLND